MDLFQTLQKTKLEALTRRHFIRHCVTGLGAAALGSLWACDQRKSRNLITGMPERASATSPLPAHYLPKAKRVIYMHMAGAPSQLELFDYKPLLQELHGQDCPASLLEGKRFAFIQGVPKMLGPQAKFAQHGQSGAWISDHMPHLASVADEVSFLKAMHTDEFNHAPAQLYMLTGSARLGRPSIGSWVAYGLGTENDNLPGYIVLVSGGKTPDAGKSAWGSGFLPTVYQGVQCRSVGEPVLYSQNPEGISRDLRRQTLDAIEAVNQKHYAEMGDPEILSRIAQYEMAFRMQLSVPDVMDISQEPAYIHEMYGTEPGKASFANNCLLARRLAEKDVRFIQLFHWGWDTHGTSKDGSLNHGFQERCKEVDQPVAALIRDLKQRGMLEDTLLVWGGEFGRTPMMENRGGRELAFNGRDHHTEAFTIWLAGGGIKPGVSHGITDEIGYYGVEGRTHIHDLQATILHLLGLNHEKLTYHFQGRDFRLTDVHGHLVNEVLA